MLRPPHFVLVVTYGRSGSTLLMGILNTIPGARVTGENLNVLFLLYRAIAAAKSTKGVHGSKKTTPRQAWYGAEEIGVKAFRRKLLDAFKTEILGVTGLETVIGYKEIRYGHEHMADHELEGFISFILKEIPRSVIVINTRNLDATAGSAWQVLRSNVREKLAHSDARLRRLAESKSDRVIHVHYDDYLKDNELLIREFARVGIRIDPKRMADVLSKRHSSVVGVKEVRPPAGKRSKLRRMIGTLRSRTST